MKPNAKPNARSNAATFNAFGIIEAPKRKTFVSKGRKVRVEIQYAQIAPRQWIAEYYFCFHTASCEGGSLPLSTQSRSHAIQRDAVADAGERMVQRALHLCGDASKMSAAQQAALAELIQWVEKLAEKATPKPKQPSKPKPLSGITFGDLFAGIGGFRLGMESLGAKCAYTVEIDKHACETYRENFNTLHHPFFHDIRQIDETLLKDCDIVCGGFPCQSFSHAGDRKGYKDKNKGKLFFDIVRIAAEKRPKLLILENVRGFVSHENGETIRRAHRELGNIGYAVVHKVLDSSRFGVAQKRMRVFLVCVRLDLLQDQKWQFVFPDGNADAPIIDDILEHHFKVDASLLPKMQRTAASQTAPANKPMKVGMINGKSSQGSVVYSSKGVGTTLVCHNNAIYETENGIHRLTPRECARMQGFPDDYKLNKSDTQAKKQLGNSVAVPVVQALAEAVAAAFLSPRVQVKAPARRHAAVWNPSPCQPHASGHQFRQPSAGGSASPTHPQQPEQSPLH